jgi:hypothetical protein
MIDKTGGPAFPTDSQHQSGASTWHHEGATLRDYLAAKALPAIVAAYVEANGRCIGTDHIHYNCAGHAYRMADAMLAERNKK